MNFIKKFKAETSEASRGGKFWNFYEISTKMSYFKKNCWIFIKEYKAETSEASRGGKFWNFQSKTYMKMKDFLTIDETSCLESLKILLEGCISFGGLGGLEIFLYLTSKVSIILRIIAKMYIFATIFIPFFQFDT